MPLIRATGTILDGILEDTYPLWGAGLSFKAYGQWNRAQEITEWGKGHLRRLALMDGTTVLASAKRYDLQMQLDGRPVPTLGVGAVFTPHVLRGRGHARALIEALESEARADGARLSLLFSEIGATYYERLGYTVVPLQTVDIKVNAGRGAPAMLVRSGEERDAVQVAEMSVARAGGYRLGLLPDAALTAYSVAKKRLYVGLNPECGKHIDYFVAEEGYRAVAFVLIVTSVTPRGVVSWSLEACGDRDPTGARIGAMLQVLLARAPAEAHPVIRGWWPSGLRPPQLRISRRLPAGDVMMVKSLDSSLPTPVLSSDEAVFWHGDAF